MPWWLASPGHQQSWYWSCRKHKSLSSMPKNFKYLCHINMEKWLKIQIYIYFSSKWFSTTRVKYFKCGPVNIKFAHYPHITSKFHWLSMILENILWIRKQDSKWLMRSSEIFPHLKGKVPTMRNLEPVKASYIGSIRGGGGGTTNSGSSNSNHGVPIWSLFY